MATRIALNWIRCEDGDWAELFGVGEQVREVAAETEQVMREENSDWFGVMRFHDMELIT